MAAVGKAAEFDQPLVAISEQSQGRGGRLVCTNSAHEIVRRLPAGLITLVVDTTKVGFHHRLLSIGVVFKKRTLPLTWSVRQGRKGHTQKCDEQLALFKKVAQTTSHEAEIWVVLAMTEFQSVRLLCWFRRHNWHFVIHQRGKRRLVGADKPGSRSMPLRSAERRYTSHRLGTLDGKTSRGLVLAAPALGNR